MSKLPRARVRKINGRSPTLEAARVRKIDGRSPTLEAAPRRVPWGLTLGLFCGGQMAWCAYLWAVLTITPYVIHASDLGSHTFSIHTVIFAVFPITGIAMAAIRIARGVRARRLLRDGIEARARLVYRWRTGTSEEDVPIPELDFEFTSHTGQEHHFSVMTMNPGPIEDEATEAILYDPKNPDRATTLDHLPGAPQIVDGKLVARSGRELGWPLLLVFVLIGVVTWLVVTN